MNEDIIQSKVCCATMMKPLAALDMKKWRKGVNTRTVFFLRRFTIYCRFMYIFVD